MKNFSVDELYINLKNCNICPRNCNINRFQSTDGICAMRAEIKIASYGPHYGEEPEIVGFICSGTIFFSGCNLLCNFCQNYDISHFKEGRYISETELADIMLKLQELGASNINLVTPTHFSPQIIRAIEQAKRMDLSIPIVYNSSGYDKIETLKYWEGIVDIYMPDLKFCDIEKSRKYCNSPDYFEVASAAILEMHRQVGDLFVKSSTARRGLLIRHLILPNNQADTKEIIDFVANNIGTNTYLNLMEQYRPCYKSDVHKLLNCRLNPDEYREYIEYARGLGFSRPEYIYKEY